MAKVCDWKDVRWYSDTCFAVPPGPSAVGKTTLPPPDLAGMCAEIEAIRIACAHLQCIVDRAERPEGAKLDPAVRGLIADMAVCLGDFECNAFDGDPHRRDSDFTCKRARVLIDQANAVYEGTSNE